MNQSITNYPTSPLKRGRFSAPAKKPSDLGILLMTNVQFALSGSNLLAEYSIPEEKLICDMDVNQISQVIDNMAINAVQAMPSGGSLKVKAGRSTLNESEVHGDEKPGNYVYFEITDSGVGIPKSIFSKIFDPFFTTKHDKGGTGLGLPIIKNIMELHNGRIVINNRDQGGVKVTATFRV